MTTQANIPFSKFPRFSDFEQADATYCLGIAFEVSARKNLDRFVDDYGVDFVTKGVLDVEGFPYDDQLILFMTFDEKGVAEEWGQIAQQNYNAQMSQVLELESACITDVNYNSSMHTIPFEKLMAASDIPKNSSILMGLLYKPEAEMLGEIDYDRSTEVYIGNACEALASRAANDSSAPKYERHTLDNREYVLAGFASVQDANLVNSFARIGMDVEATEIFDLRTLER